MFQHLSTLGIHLTLVLHQDFKPDSAVRTDAARLDLALVEKLDERGVVRCGACRQLPELSVPDEPG